MPAEILLFLAKKYKTILVFGLLFGGIFSLYGKFIANDKFSVPSILQNTVYTADLGGSTNPLSALAEIGNFSLAGSGGSAENNEMVMIKKMQTRYFFNQLVEKDPTIRHKIFAAKNYDFETSSLIYYERIYDSKAKKWKKNINSESIHKYFLKSLAIKYSMDDGLIYLSYEHPSPFFAKEMIESIVDLFNDTYKIKALYEADKSIDVLNNEISLIQSPLITSSTGALIQNHIQEKIFARVKPALTYVEPPYVPNEPSSWGTAIWLIMGFLIGIVLGCIYLLRSNLGKLT